MSDTSTKAPSDEVGVEDEGTEDDDEDYIERNEIDAGFGGRPSRRLRPVDTAYLELRAGLLFDLWLCIFIGLPWLICVSLRILLEVRFLLVLIL